MRAQTLSDYLQNLLDPRGLKDYCPNGWQVEGTRPIKKIVSGVSLNQAFIDQAIEAKADGVLVHHGFFFKNEPLTLNHIRRQRMASVLSSGLHVFAYHLPLDVHPVYGNNVQLAKILDIEVEGPLEDYYGQAMGLVGRLQQPLTVSQLSGHIEKSLSRKPLIIESAKESIEKVAWCTGAAQDYIEAAYDKGADAFITGEISERSVALAKELGVHFISAGHHATERYGVIALGDHLAKEFSLDHQFIDVDNPV